MPINLPSVWRDEDEPDFFHRDELGADPTLSYTDEGDFDVRTADGILSILAHVEQDVEDEVRAGLAAWDEAQLVRELLNILDNVRSICNTE